jgi:hypothetical protein
MHVESFSDAPFPVIEYLLIVLPPSLEPFSDAQWKWLKRLQSRIYIGHVKTPGPVWLFDAVLHLFIILIHSSCKSMFFAWDVKPRRRDLRIPKASWTSISLSSRLVRDWTCSTRVRKSFLLFKQPRGRQIPLKWPTPCDYICLHQQNQAIKPNT